MVNPARSGGSDGDVERHDGALKTALLVWSFDHLRELPWRATRDPWAILVAETMLQQTQVSRVAQRWQPFLDRFGDPVRTADAGAAEVVRAWAGLGYNRRAVMLHGAATAITREHDGEVPDGLAALMALPGVGPYTARAVLAFAFEQPAGPVDTNIGRVLARLGGGRLSRAEAQQRADDLVVATDAWRWNQALMELGATVCTKREPRCDRCPVVGSCAWRGSGADPADGSAAVSRAQGRFAGSDRQLRGRLVDALRAGPVALPELRAVLDVGAEDCARIVDGLLADGLAQSDGTELRLGGELSPAR